ncbi:iron export ABC transporter permease subunit FetB [Paludibacterium sp. THUN1379]|uniref:ABC transporter permease n=1 Tax=Paludibacterium sp. THUN1379 TaxID=3112107 RepID=UPI003090C5A6|nr:iron export ABC transporter permease subunit FetB [Paludibacterium sp. THUN1379]
MTGYIQLGYGDLLLASVLVLTNAALSLRLHLGLERKLLVAALRMVLQLSLMGWVLVKLFAWVSPLATLLAALTMVGFAGHEAVSRQQRPMAGWWGYGLGTGSMFLAAALVTIFALTTALRPDPWYDPRYAIPLLGMILGNTMTGIGLGMNGLANGLYNRRAAIEARLMLGHDRRSALAPVTREALVAAMLPIINVMSASGVVALPGMMTGQILGGVPPAQAVKYQILILFLIGGGTGLGALAAVLGGVYRLTDSRHRLRLDRLRSLA